MEFIQALKENLDDFTYCGKRLVRSSNERIFLVNSEHDSYVSLLVRELKAYDCHASEVIHFYREVISRYYVTKSNERLSDRRYTRVSIAFSVIDLCVLDGDSADTIYGTINNTPAMQKTRVLFGCAITETTIVGYTIINCHLSARCKVQRCHMIGCIVADPSVRIDSDTYLVGCDLPKIGSEIKWGNYYSEVHAYVDTDGLHVLSGPTKGVNLMIEVVEKKYKGNYTIVWKEPIENCPEGHTYIKFMLAKKPPKTIFTVMASILGCST